MVVYKSESHVGLWVALLFHQALGLVGLNGRRDGCIHTKVGRRDGCIHTKPSELFISRGGRLSQLETIYTIR